MYTSNVFEYSKVSSNLGLQLDHYKSQWAFHVHSTLYLFLLKLIFQHLSRIIVPNKHFLWYPKFFFVCWIYWLFEIGPDYQFLQPRKWRTKLQQWTFWYIFLDVHGPIFYPVLIPIYLAGRSIFWWCCDIFWMSEIEIFLKSALIWGPFLKYWDVEART